MAGPVEKEPRLGWLDGLRGLAAMQVVLLHYAFVFLPAIVAIHPLNMYGFSLKGLVGTPLVFMYDGNAAVFLFFIISGVALTHAFAARPLDFPTAVLRRVIRLGLPMAAAVVFAAALFALLPDAHVAASERSGSTALRDIGPREISLPAIIHQIAFEGLLSGFSDFSLLPEWLTKGMGLVPRGQGFNTPLWTLHFEFYGSLLVMLLVGVRASTSRTIYRAGCVLLACAFALSPLGLFIVGHVSAGYLRRVDGRRWQLLVGPAFLGSGILLCTAQIIAPESPLGGLLPLLSPASLAFEQVLQKMLGAILVFGGLALMPVLHRQLERPGLRWLGKISFSLYLSHYPLLYTCSAACFLLLSDLSFGAGVAAVTVVGIVLSLLIAVPFERWIDRPAIRLSRMVGGARRRAAAPMMPVAVTEAA
jgi:peptidoglycan/LPS O-acetylase OafA/YrhL